MRQDGAEGAKSGRGPGMVAVGHGGLRGAGMVGRRVISRLGAASPTRPP